MPVLLFALLLAAIVFLTPLSFLTVPPVPAPAPVPYASEQVVQINTATGATRFTPYRLVPELDRRTTNRA